MSSSTWWNWQRMTHHNRQSGFLFALSWVIHFDGSQLPRVGTLEQPYGGVSVVSNRSFCPTVTRASLDAPATVQPSDDRALTDISTETSRDCELELLR